MKGVVWGDVLIFGKGELTRTMSQTFKVQQNITYSELLSASYYQISRMKIIRRFVLFPTLFNSIILVILTILSFSNGINWYQLIFQLISIPFFFIAFVFGLTTLGMTILKLTQPFRYQDNTYSFTHWGMEKTGNGVEFTRPWRNFLKFRESNNFIYLYISENDAHIIQKRMFNDKYEEECFKQFVTENIENK